MIYRLIDICETPTHYTCEVAMFGVSLYDNYIDSLIIITKLPKQCVDPVNVNPSAQVNQWLADGKPDPLCESFMNFANVLKSSHELAVAEHQGESAPTD